MYFFIALILFPATAFAYVDPGSGSYFFQILLATVLGALFSIKVFWKKTFTYIKKLLNREKKRDQ